MSISLKMLNLPSKQYLENFKKLQNLFVEQDKKIDLEPRTTGTNLYKQDDNIALKDVKIPKVKSRGRKPGSNKTVAGTKRKLIESTENVENRYKLRRKN